MEDRLHEQIEEATHHIAKEHSPEIKKGMDDIMKNIFEKGMLPKDAMGMSDTMVEGIYGHAYRLYNTGKYNDACQLFRLLIMLNPTSVKYILGLAACFHMVKEYKHAATVYAMANIIDPQTPVPYYHASDCYISMGDAVAAKVALEMAIKKSGDLPQYSVIKERCLFTLESLKAGTAGGIGNKQSSEHPEVPQSM